MKQNDRELGVFFSEVGEMLDDRSEELTTPYTNNTYHQQNELVSVMLEDHGKATWKKF